MSTPAIARLYRTKCSCNFPSYDRDGVWIVVDQNVPINDVVQSTWTHPDPRTQSVLTFIRDHSHKFVIARLRGPSRRKARGPATCERHHGDLNDEKHIVFDNQGEVMTISREYLSFRTTFTQGEYFHKYADTHRCSCKYVNASSQGT
jgi:hypothetical protein